MRFLSVNMVLTSKRDLITFPQQSVPFLVVNFFSDDINYTYFKVGLLFTLGVSSVYRFYFSQIFGDSWSSAHIYK